MRFDHVYGRHERCDGGRSTPGRWVDYRNPGLVLGQTISGNSGLVKPRRTARVLVFDAAGRVLLIRCAMVLTSGDDFVFWVTPGGEIEPGEAARPAAAGSGER